LIWLAPCTWAFSAFPHFLEVGILALELGDLLLQHAPAALGGVVLLLLEGFALES